MHFAVQKDVFLTLKYGNTRWRSGLRPGPRWGSLRRPPDLLVGWGGDTPPQTLYPAQSLRRFDCRAFGASNFAPSALNFIVPIVNLRNDHCAVLSKILKFKHFKRNYTLQNKRLKITSTKCRDYKSSYYAEFTSRF